MSSMDYSGAQLLNDVLAVVLTPNGQSLIQKLSIVPSYLRNQLLLECHVLTDNYLRNTLIRNTYEDIINSLSLVPQNPSQSVSDPFNQQFCSTFPTLQIRGNDESSNQALQTASTTSSAHIPHTINTVMDSRIPSLPMAESTTQQNNVMNSLVMNSPPAVPEDEKNNKNNNPFLDALEKIVDRGCVSSSENVPNPPTPVAVQSPSFQLTPPHLTSHFETTSSTGEVVRSFAKRPRHLSMLPAVKLKKVQPVGGHTKKGYSWDDVIETHKKLCLEKSKEAAKAEARQVDTSSSSSKDAVKRQRLDVVTDNVTKTGSDQREDYLDLDYLDIESEWQPKTQKAAVGSSSKRGSLLPTVGCKSAEKVFVCEWCPNYVVKTKYSYDVHLEKFHNKGLMKQCEKCDRWYNNDRFDLHSSNCITNSLRKRLRSSATKSPKVQNSKNADPMSAEFAKKSQRNLASLSNLNKLNP